MVMRVNQDVYNKIDVWTYFDFEGYNWNWNIGMGLGVAYLKDQMKENHLGWFRRVMSQWWLMTKRWINWEIKIEEI